MISEKITKGMLLIAEPSIIGDISFNRSVILLADHNEEGSVGFILNKPLQYTVNDLVPDIESDFEIYNGGPVEQDNLYFIHNVPDLIQDSIEISDGIFWGGNILNVKNLINDNVIKKENIRFFLGYTGWDVNQLALELNNNTWIISKNIYKSEILNKSTDYFWRDKIIEQGGDYLLWSNAPENPNLN